jgi:pimeloyl-ACP methyl ester carboxylesterase
MHKRLLMVTVLVTSFFYSEAQTLISATLKESWNQQQIDSFYTSQGLPSALLPNSYGVEIYQVKYNTVSYDGVTPAVASGLMVLPQNKTCASPILSYQHGTVLKRLDGPSFLTGEYIIGVAMGADGYIGIMPDYLGLGLSPGLHPYVHANSEATAVADMIRATREACDNFNFDYNDQIFLTGYSQGGHATMAAHKYLSQSFPNEFNVVAAVPMSGPYSLSEVMRDLILSNTPYSNPAYLPMVIQTYRTVYNIYPNISDAILAPFDTLIPTWTSGTYSSSYVDNKMTQLGANPPKLIIKPAVLDTFTNDSTHILRVLLKQNDVYRWTPQVPVHMLYCEADEQVSYLNTLKAYDYMTAVGAPHITKKNINSTLGHTECAQFALLEMRSFFDTMRYDKFTINTTNYQFANGPSSPNGSISINVVGGQNPVTILWSDGQQGSTANNLLPGNYTVTVTGADGCSATENYVMGYLLGVEGNSTNETKTIHPNPTSDVLYLNNLLGEYTISDMSGRVISKGFSTSEKGSIDVSTLTKGTYLFQNGNFRMTFIKI